MVMAMDYVNPLHWDQRFARETRFGDIIAPQSIAVALDYGHGGATMAAWNTDYLAFWAGHDGMVRHAKSAFRGPAFEGDVTFIEGTVLQKIEDSAWGFPVVQIEVIMTNQNGKVIVKALSEVELPH